MITALEARHKSEDAFGTNVNVDMDYVYQFINSCIEEATKKGDFSTTVHVDGCDESWDTVYHKREKIIEYYWSLGYSITPCGYDRSLCSDVFFIEW